MTPPSKPSSRRGDDELVAHAMGADPVLLPLLPELLADFGDLGGWAERTAELLANATTLGSGDVVVDLGCGKGASSVAIARRLGCRVVGVDLFTPFLEAAAAAARQAGVGGLCSFELRDLRETIEGGQRFDAALFAAVGAGLFGGVAECVGDLRRCVRTGGHIVLGEGFLSPAGSCEAPCPGYEYYRPHAETVRALTAHGDRLVRELVIPADAFARRSAGELSALRERARQLGERHPESADRLASYVAAQETEYAYLVEATVEAIWLLRRA